MLITGFLISAETLNMNEKFGMLISVRFPTYLDGRR